MKHFAPAILCLAFASASALPQDTAAPKPATLVKTFYLNNVSGVADGNEVVTALRNMVRPDVKIYFVASENAITVSTTADQMLLLQQILHDLDRPRTVYRLTYTITDSDQGKRIGIQHFAMIVSAGQRTSMKEGSKVPVVTGTFNPGTSTSETQNTYLDIGMNFDANITESINGLTLRSKVEQSSLAEEKPTYALTATTPVVRQAVLEGTSVLTLGKPLVLGSLDVPGSTRHLDVEVVAEAIK